MQRARYSQHPCRAQQQQATSCTCGRYALSVVELLSNLRSVTYHLYLSAGAIQQLHAACLCTYVASYQPGAVEVQTVSTSTAVWVEIVQIVFLTMATVRFSQAAKIRQQYVRILHLPVV